MEKGGNASLRTERRLHLKLAEQLHKLGLVVSESTLKKQDKSWL